MLLAQPLRITVPYQDKIIVLSKRLSSNSIDSHTTYASYSTSPCPGSSFGSMQSLQSVQSQPTATASPITHPPAEDRTGVGRLQSIS